MTVIPVLGLAYRAQLSPLGVGQVPALALIASGQQAIGKLRVRLVEGQGTPASRARVANGLWEQSAMVQSEYRIQRRVSLIASPYVFSEQQLFIE